MNILVHKLRNRNFFQMDKQLEGSIPSAPISIRCPHCRELGSFNIVKSCAFHYSKNAVHPHNSEASYSVGYLATIRVCPNTDCKGIVLVLQEGEKAVEIEPPQLLDFNPNGLPAQCAATLQEAVACHAAGSYRAAAMMVRRLLEEICEANGAIGSNLHERLISLKSKIVLPNALFEAMNELKALGNDAAHIEAKAFDSIGREEAEDSIELAKEILKALYQLQGLLSRLQARKTPSGSAAA